MLSKYTTYQYLNDKKLLTNYFLIPICISCACKSVNNCLQPYWLKQKYSRPYCVKLEESSLADLIELFALVVRIFNSISNWSLENMFPVPDHVWECNGPHKSFYVTLEYYMIPQHSLRSFHWVINRMKKVQKKCKNHWFKFQFGQW